MARPDAMVSRSATTFPGESSVDIRVCYEEEVRGEVAEVAEAEADVSAETKNEPPPSLTPHRSLG